MFKFARNNEVLWPVEIQAPSAGGSGRVEAFRIKMRFRLLSRSEARTLEGASPEESEAILRDHIHGWDDVCDETGEALEFNEDNLKALLDLPYIERAVVKALLQATVGAPAKN